MSRFLTWAAVQVHGMEAGSRHHCELARAEPAAEGRSAGWAECSARGMASKAPVCLISVMWQ